ncbi:Rieske 2Fe-2S domain-containing protein [Primorskyibacter flagellatus]|uniref:Ferredoxin-NADP reductase n=1 Tax=Primorskyibacter flagellatus TaxID=1387277 RepID=A0A1W2DXN1_9RHOB|nr:Rieske 2Fe-2S domain-containing protein [Primorskyibacter flagellatus]SMD02193.1 Ferredoxin-NADP reductase [Primorskyibacter flagellatus]
MMSDLHSNWYPIASSSDLPKRHVYQAQLLGREFAVWRADDGHVNVWENRCLHRGVRLSIGINNGTELKCQYHGWRYANRTAGCTYIPAHPADAPARTICNNTYPAIESHGLVWSGEEASGDLLSLDGFDSATVLRAVPVFAPMNMVAEALLGYGWDDSCKGAANDDGSVTVTAGDGTAVRIFVQPMDSNHSVMRGLVNQAPAGAGRAELLQTHSWLMQELRDRVEVLAAKQEAPAPYEPVIAKVSEDLVDIPALGTDGRKAELRVQLVKKEMTAEGIVSLRLEPIKGQLPTFQPGAHIDVHLPNGLVRQYSITNGPGETDHYTIGVKREGDGRGGSAAVHDSLQEGDVLAISAPRNNFPLRRDAEHTVFIAGGIGVTPMIAMARALNAQGLSFEFHYFVQSDDHVAFKQQIGEFERALTIHKGLSPEATGAKLKEVLAEPGFARHVYICGPGPMLEATRGIAASQGWTDEAVHFEYFANTAEVDDSTAFEVDLARSALTLQVPAGKTILEVLREHGIDMPSSCEQGACGTCRCGVIEGEVIHQDVYLSNAEKAEGKSIMTCVSRAASDRLILDI